MAVLLQQSVIAFYAAGWLRSACVASIGWSAMKLGRSVSALWQSRAGLPFSWYLILVLGALPGLSGVVSVRPGKALAFALAGIRRGAALPVVWRPPLLA